LLIVSFFFRFDFSFFDVFSFFFRLVSSESFVERASFFFVNVVVYRESSLSFVNLTSYFEEFVNLSFVVSTIVSFAASLSQSIVIVFDHHFLSFVAFTSIVTRKRTRSIVSSVSNKKNKIVERACVCIVSKKWMKEIKTIDNIKNSRKIEQLLNEMYYLSREMCRDHINRLKYVFEMLSTINVVNMNHQLYDFFEYNEIVKVFKIEHSDWFEIASEDDDDENENE
jgi:hypothetical protein